MSSQASLEPVRETLIQAQPRWDRRTGRRPRYLSATRVELRGRENLERRTMTPARPARSPSSDLCLILGGSLYPISVVVDFGEVPRMPPSDPGSPTVGSRCAPGDAHIPPGHRYVQHVAVKFGADVPEVCIVPESNAALEVAWKIMD